MARTVLNPNALPANQYALTTNLAGRHIVVPAVQERGSDFSMYAGIFLRDLYSEYPDDAKAALRLELARAS